MAFVSAMVFKNIGERRQGYLFFAQIEPKPSTSSAPVQWPRFCAEFPCPQTA